jgi:hypothetical protein
MTKNELNKLIATYIVAIGPSGRPNSYVWMEVDKNMENLDRHQAILGALISADLVKEQFHFLTLTDKGKEMYNKLVELYLPKIVTT